MNYLDKLTEIIKAAPKEKRAELVKSLPPKTLNELKYHWPFWARPEQLFGKDFRVCLCMPGRGWGKTRSGSEWIRYMVSQGAKDIALVGPRFDHVRDQMLFDPESGIMAVFPPHERPRFVKNENTLYFKNGARAIIYTGEAYENIRGGNKDAAWIDELCLFPYPKEAYDMLMLALRKGASACLITSTPKPLDVFEQIYDSWKAGTKNIKVVEGSTFDNRDNLSDIFFDQLINEYDGTRMGRQELYGEILRISDQAKWSVGLLNDARLQPGEKLPDIREFERIVIAVDPAVTNNENSDMTGIMVAGRLPSGVAWLLEDATNRYSPQGWADKVAELYRTYRANAVICETNQGGDLVVDNIKSALPGVAPKRIHAKQGKGLRADPVVAKYEKKLVRHAQRFDRLESQMLRFTGDPRHLKNDDCIDAMVYALTDLLIKPVDSFINFKQRAFV